MSVNALVDYGEASSDALSVGVQRDPLSLAIHGLIAVARAQGLLEVPGEGPERHPVAVGAHGLALMRILGGGSTQSEERLLDLLGAGRLLLLHALELDCLTPLFESLKSEPSAVAGILDSHNVVIFLRNGPSRIGNPRALHEARCIAARARRSSSSVVCAISPAVNTARDLEGAFDDCREAVALGKRNGEPLIHVDEIWSEIVLTRIQRHIAQCMTLSTPISRLMEHDREHDTDFVPTLRTWFAQGEDARTTAQQLGIHSNTLRYRLRRISELVDLDLQEASQKLAAGLIVGSL